MRIGILGASRIAESAIVGPARELGYRLVTVAARDPLRAKAFADKYGVERVLDSYQEVVSDPEVDMIYNPLANSLHAPWNLAAIAAGKPVLTEKPFARDQAEAQRVEGTDDAEPEQLARAVVKRLAPAYLPRLVEERAPASSQTPSQPTRPETVTTMNEPEMTPFYFNLQGLDATAWPSMPSTAQTYRSVMTPPKYYGPPPVRRPIDPNVTPNPTNANELMHLRRAAAEAHVDGALQREFEVGAAQ